MSKKKNYTPIFKFMAALAALFGKKTILELYFESGVYQSLIKNWRKQFKELV